MLNLLGSLGLVALALVSWRTLIRTGVREPSARKRIGVIVAMWFIVITALAALGAFAVDRIGTMFVGLAVVAPVIAGVALTARSSAVRASVLAIPIATLIAVNVGRLLGAFFLFLHADGRLPATFAHTAGWGDIAVAVLAIPVAWAAYRKVSGWQVLALAWNVFGFVDLITAVTLGVGSSDSPLRFIHESPATGTIATLPWTLIPGFMVPMYFLTHLAIFAQFRKSWAMSAVSRPARA